MTHYIRNSGNAWTPEGIALLRQLIQQNTPTRVIGLKLGRTENAIRAKAQELGLSLGPWNQSPYGSK